MTTESFTPTRLTRRYTQTIGAAPDRVFPLLCPVREAEWLDGWRHRMIHSESGLVEDGAVFTTPGAGETDTVWIVTRLDPVNHLVEFARFTHQSRVCLLRIAVRPNAQDRSFVDIAYTCTTLSPSGDAFLDRAFSEAAFLGAMTFWERSMNHWLATGERLPGA